jgi:hypothetical protein
MIGCLQTANSNAILLDEMWLAGWHMPPAQEMATPWLQISLQEIREHMLCMMGIQWPKHGKGKEATV